MGKEKGEVREADWVVRGGKDGVVGGGYGVVGGCEAGFYGFGGRGGTGFCHCGMVAGYGVAGGFEAVRFLVRIAALGGFFRVHTVSCHCEYFVVGLQVLGWWFLYIDARVPSEQRLVGGCKR